MTKYVKRFGINASANNVIIFYGWKEALNVIFNALISFGMNFYHMKYDMIAWSGNISSIGANVVGLDYDNEGILPSALLKKVDPSKKNILYLNNINHYPTGVTMSAKRRQEIIKICKQYNLPVIENDMLRDLWIEEPPPPIRADLPHTVYVGTFDNMVHSGMRLAWAVVPAAIRERLTDVKLQYHSTNNNILEILANDMLENGYYTECMWQIRAKLPRRIETINAILAKHMKDVAQWEPINSIYHIWMKLAENVNSLDVFNATPHYICPSTVGRNNPKNYILLNALCASIEEFTTGVSDVAKAIKKLSNKSVI